MFDSFNPDLEIENNSFDLLIQDEPDLFYRSIDHEFSQINKPSTIGIKINTSDAKLVLENFIWGNESLLSEGLTLPKNESKVGYNFKIEFSFIKSKCWHILFVLIINFDTLFKLLFGILFIKTWIN